MTEYCHIGRQACDGLLSDKLRKPEEMMSWADDYSYFAYRLSLWELRVAQCFSNTSSRPGVSMVQTILGIRTNHLRTLIARALSCSQLRSIVPSGTSPSISHLVSILVMQPFLRSRNSGRHRSGGYADICHRHLAQSRRRSDKHRAHHYESEQLIRKLSFPPSTAKSFPRCGTRLIILHRSLLIFNVNATRHRLQGKEKLRHSTQATTRCRK
jgi:hypothetical protein